MTFLSNNGFKIVIFYSKILFFEKSHFSALAENTGLQEIPFMDLLFTYGKGIDPTSSFKKLLEKASIAFASRAIFPIALFKIGYCIKPFLEF